MTEYRRAVGEGTSKHYYVRMGPIPDLPDWHELAKPVSYPFPTLPAATEFAQRCKVANRGREVVIDYPDGRRWDGKEFVA